MVSLPSTPGQGARTASRELVAHIIHQRVDEIFQLVGREFERAGYGAGRLPAGVVLSGGTAHLPGMVELAREVFATPVRAGIPSWGFPVSWTVCRRRATRCPSAWCYMPRARARAAVRRLECCSAAPRRSCSDLSRDGCRTSSEP